MASKRTAIAFGLAIVLLATVVFGGMLFGRSLVSGLSPIDQLGAAMQRLATTVASDTAQLGLLMLVCGGFGLLVLVDRRRRSKVRRASC